MGARFRTPVVMVSVLFIAATLCGGAEGSVGDAVCAFSDRYPVEIPVLDGSQVRQLVETAIDIDDVRLLNGPGMPGTVVAYVNDSERSRLEADGYAVTPIRNLAKEAWREVAAHWEATGAHEAAADPAAKDGRYDNWYTHAQLGAELQAIADANPNLVRLISIGNSVQGRAIWFVKISDNVTVEENEPEMKFTSSIHGDEVVGMELSRLMIHHLLDNYGTDPAITNLVNNAELWFCPLHNPDGMTNGTRYNAQGYDLNRKFPDPITDPNDTPAGRPIEVQHMMNFQYPRNFILGSNYHGGALVMNLPWDCQYALAPDDALFWYLGEGYSYRNPPMWNSGTFYHGVTNGADWYVVHGGFQDWAYHWRNELHITIEVSNTKWPAGNQMTTYWNNNRDAMLWYMNQVLTTGIKGTVTDIATGQPLAATVMVNEIGKAIISDLEVGDYHRMLRPGTYSVTCSKNGYQPVTYTNVVVTDGQFTVRDVQLSNPTDVSEAGAVSRLALSLPAPNPAHESVRALLSLAAESPVQASVYDLGGRAVRALVAPGATLSAGDHELSWDGRDDSGRRAGAGIYWIRVTAGDQTVDRKVVLVQ